VKQGESRAVGIGKCLAAVGSSEGNMRETRRRFLAMVAVCGSAIATGSALQTTQQNRRIMPNPPPPSQPKDQDTTDTSKPNPQAVKRAMLIQNEKEFREGVERLYQLSGELRDEVQKTPNTEVFSVHMYKKAEEIEKLAKQLKGKAKG
jgi:hypothetical protein